MARYFYTAKSLKGEEKSGVLEAENKQELAKVLRQEGFLLTSAILEEEKEKKGLLIDIPALFSVSLKDKIFFTRNLRVMIGAGIGLPRALNILASQTKSKRFFKALEEVAYQVTKGKSFSEALAGYPNIFSEVFVSMIKVGEKAGKLEEVLEILTSQMESVYELRSKIKGAILYPAVVVLAMIGIGILMLIMVVPKLAKTFEELKIELPPTTQFVISLGQFLAQRWYVFLLMIPVLSFVLSLVLKTEKGRKIKDSLLLKLPIVAPLVQKTNSAYTARTISSLLSSGVPIAQSLEIVSGTLGNVYFKKAMEGTAKKVREGSKLSEVLGEYKVYPDIVIQMMRVGEETGETSRVLSQLADFFEEEVANATKNLASVIEPVLMLLIGGVVGFFAISMVQPMYSMLGAIK